MNEEKQTIVPPNTLQQKLQKHIEDTGRVSSADIATFKSKETKAQKTPESAQFNRSTVIEKDDPGSPEPLLRGANGTTDAEHLSKGTESTNTKDLNPLDRVAIRRHKVVITPEDKEAFIASVINNTRMELEFPVLGGRLMVRVRSRKVPETRAIIARERVEISKGIVVTQMDYTLRLRSMLMAAQISEFRGTEYEEMAEPLMPVARADGEDTPPAWLEWIDYWAGMGDGTHAVLWDCIQRFEDKYWRMVEDAQNADFWEPAASTSE